MKKKIALICVLVLILSSFARTVGAIDVILNSATVHFPDQEPVIENWVTLVPLRPIAEALGLEIGWDDPTDTVTLKKDNFFIELVIGSTTAKTSSGTKTLLTPPCIRNGRTMVPLRFIAEELGLKVSWNTEYLRVIIAGQVETQNIAPPPVEETTAVEEESTDYSEDSTDVTEKASEEIFEEETMVEEFGDQVVIDAASSSIILDIPDTYLPEDTDLEDSFAYRSLDGFDAQHTYNWDIVSRYESYANESGTSGILFVVQDLEPYEGEQYDISAMNQELPEPPERPERPQWPELDFETMIYELERVLLEQVFIDLEVEIPEDLMDLEEDAVIELLGLESAEELEEQRQISMDNADLSQVPGYDEYLNWQDENTNYNEEMQFYNEEYAVYLEEYNEIMGAKNFAMRHFQKYASEVSEDDWVELFTTLLNTDVEVRYEGVEVLEFNSKYIVHATIYAEDPDDEQGVYEYYRYIDGDTLVTIFGGTLFGSEPGEEITDILSNMMIQ